MIFRVKGGVKDGVAALHSMECGVSCEEGVIASGAVGVRADGGDFGGG